MVLIVASALALAGGALGLDTAQAASRPSKAKGAAADGSAWSMDLDCSLCHAAQVASIEEKAGDNKESTDAKAPGSAAGDVSDTQDAAEKTGANESLVDEAPSGLESYAAMHAHSFGMTCADCHEDSDKLADAHKRMNGGTEATRLKKTAVASELCLACHDADTLAEATAECTVLTDDNGTTINPHQLPEVGEHAGINCADCHQVHEAEKTLAQTARTTCGSCHHAGVYECGTCH